MFFFVFTITVSCWSDNIITRKRLLFLKMKSHWARMGRPTHLTGIPRWRHFEEQTAPAMLKSKGPLLQVTFLIVERSVWIYILNSQRTRFWMLCDEPKQRKAKPLSRKLSTNVVSVVKHFSCLYRISSKCSAVFNKALSGSWELAVGQLRKGFSGYQYIDPRATTRLGQAPFQKKHRRFKESEGDIYGTTESVSQLSQYLKVSTDWDLRLSSNRSIQCNFPQRKMFRLAAVFAWSTKTVLSPVSYSTGAPALHAWWVVAGRRELRGPGRLQETSSTQWIQRSQILSQSGNRWTVNITFVCLSTSINLKDSHRAKKYQTTAFALLSSYQLGLRASSISLPERSKCQASSLVRTLSDLDGSLEILGSSCSDPTNHIRRQLTQDLLSQLKRDFWTSEDRLFIDEVCLQNWYPDF